MKSRHWELRYQCSTMAIQSHIGRLIICNTSTAITIIIEREDATAKHFFLVRCDKLFVAIITFLCRYKRQLTIFQNGHIILIAFLKIKELRKVEISPLKIIKCQVHFSSPFSNK